MELKVIEPRIIFDTVVGSRAYGIHNPDSDSDRSGVCIPTSEYFFGFKKFEQFQSFPEKDRVSYDIRKAVSLILDNNPNMIDLLWVPDHCIVKSTPYWDIFRENRDLFLSKKCRWTFSGYAIAQLRRIESHRKFLLDPPTAAPKREDFGLKDFSRFPSSQLKAVLYTSLELIPEESNPEFYAELTAVYKDYVSPLFIKYVKDSERKLAMDWLQMAVTSQVKTLKSIAPYIKDEYLEEATNEIAYFTVAQTWKQYCEWNKTRNRARATLEAKYGFDTKHAGHLVRLLRMGVETLQTGQVNVDRTNIDAEELKEIRNGSWSFEKLKEYSGTMDDKLTRLYETSSLKKKPKVEAVQDLLVDVVQRYLS